MIIRLFSFSKRTNSTAVPTTTGTEADVRLKDATSVLRPSFLLQADPDAADWYAYNYVYCPTFNRYYHITNIESVKNDLWRLDCEVDVLASWKASIQAASAFVAYSASFGNAQIPDTRLSVKTDKVLTEQSASFTRFGVCTAGNKAVVLTVTGKNAVGHYVMSPALATNLLNSIDTWMDNIDVLPFTPGQGLTAVIDGLKYIGDCLIRFARQLVSTGNAADNITNVVSVPIEWTVPTGTNQEIMLGQFETGVYGNYIAESSNFRYVVDTVNIPIPWQSGDFRRQSPYTHLALSLPFIGLINIPTSEVMGDVSISVQATLDVFSGDCVFRVFGIPDTGTANAHVIGVYYTNVAASFAIGRSAQTPLQAATSIISGAASAIVNPGVVSSGSAVIGGIMGAIEATPTCISSGGGSVSMGIVDRSLCRLYLIYHDTTVGPATVNQAIGRPTMEVLNLGSCSGYVETREASVTGSMTDTEREQINRLLDGGIYIE